MLNWFLASTPQNDAENRNPNFPESALVNDSTISCIDWNGSYGFAIGQTKNRFVLQVWETSSGKVKCILKDLVVSKTMNLNFKTCEL